MIQQGDIVFSYPRDMGFYSKAVRYFTKSLWSHCFYISQPYMGEQMVFESDLKAQLVPWNKEYIQKNADVYEVFRPKLASARAIEKATRETYFDFAGETYGFFSIPWFAIRETLKRVFGFVLRKNFTATGVICSEMLVEYIKALGGQYFASFEHLKANETSPEDIYLIVKARPDLFEYIESNGKKD